MNENHSSIIIPDHELIMDFVRAAGPGGQHVNKVSTAVHLKFDVANSPSIPDRIKSRLIRLAGHRMDGKGVLHIHASGQRSQFRNRDEAKKRLYDLIQKASIRPKKRIKTKPSAAARQRVLDRKKRRGAVKSLRGRVSFRGDE